MRGRPSKARRAWAIAPALRRGGHERKFFRPTSRTAEWKNENLRKTYSIAVREETVMPQVNLRTTRQFENDLIDLMLLARVASKTAAIRFAVHQVAASYRRMEERKKAPPSQGPPLAG
jgi:hypothetical protein